MERNNAPIDTIRDGNIKASIWENDSEKGVFHSTKIAKTYEDRDGNLQDTQSFSTSDLLRVSEIAREAYRRSNELRRENTQSRDARDSGKDRDEGREKNREDDLFRGRDRKADRNASERKEEFREERRGGGGGESRRYSMPRRSDPHLRDRFSTLSFP